jgi:hypothetical protein
MTNPQELVHKMSIKVSGKAFGLVAIFFFLLLLVFFLLTGFGLDSPAIGAKCAYCHIMKPEYLTWQASSHKNFSCMECHGATSIKDKAGLVQRVAKNLYRYVTKTYSLPVQVKSEISDRRCVKCHSLNREITSATDIIVPHRKHFSKGVQCVTCHNDAAHAGIALNVLTDNDVKRFDKITEFSNLSLEDTLPKMGPCMDCHEARKVTLACAACHSGQFLPDSHEEKNFIQTHGELAARDLAYCDLCHAFIKPAGAAQQQETAYNLVETALMEITGTSMEAVIEYAKKNLYCVDCHKKLPASHNEMWSHNHGTIAKKDPVNCEACHGSGRGQSGVTAKGACSQCHPSNHSAIWRFSHPRVI